MAKVNILDCTLRDGGYVNDFEFDNVHISSILRKLQTARIDIIECGFLDSVKGKSSDLTRFDRCEAINILLAKLPATSHSIFVAMAEFGKVVMADLPDVTGNKNEVKGIRLSFRKNDHLNIFEDAKMILQKGYKLFIQPIATELYSDGEILEFIDRCNTLDIDSMYIVDTHGSMMREDFRRLYYLFEHNLNPRIRLGFHSHNNLQLSYSNAIDFIEIARYSQRDIIIDASIYGMGRGAGNLNSELLADYINKRIEMRYDIDPLLEVVDEYLATIYREKHWGYSLEHFLSASSKCHPNYASGLINKKNLSIVEIKSLLESIPIDERREFNKELMETLYIAYKEQVRLSLKPLPETFYHKRILLIASGKSVQEQMQHIVQKIDDSGYTTVCLNHLNDHIMCDYVFVTNQSRYDEFCDSFDADRLIVTSNVKVRSNHSSCYVLDYKSLFDFENINVDNVTVLMLNHLVKEGVKNVAVAGLDGYDRNEKNQYSYSEYNRITDITALESVNTDLAKAIEVVSRQIHLYFLTPSRFKKYAKQKIIGVIPARISSTRLPNKPLQEIAGLPMVVHVLKRAHMSAILDEVIVATDSNAVRSTVEAYGGKAILTSPEHQNGTLRMHEVSTKIDGDIFVLLNGDEPLIEPRHIEQSVTGLMDSNTAVASLLVTPYTERNNMSNFKVALNRNDEVMYISRNDIPSDARREKMPMWKAYHIVSYQKDFLDVYATDLQQTELDAREMDDQLRILEYGFVIQAVKTQSHAFSIDTPEDLECVRGVMADDAIFCQYGEAK